MVPNVGMAVLMDAGDGERYSSCSEKGSGRTSGARLALVNDYGVERVMAQFRLL